MTDLESALAKLRLADELPRGAMLNARECAALLARLGAADKMAAAIAQEVYYADAPDTCDALDAYCNPPQDRKEQT